MFADAAGMANAIATWLAQYEQTVVWVQPGPMFEVATTNRYTVRPTAREDYTALLHELRRQGLSPARVVHLWTLADSDMPQQTRRWRRQWTWAFLALMALTQAIGDMDIAACDISIITSHYRRLTAMNARARKRRW